MRVSSRWAALALAFAIHTGGCATNPAPRGWLLPAQASQADRYGAWIVISVHSGGPPLSGEFLAVDHDSVFVLPAGGTVRSAALVSVRRARIAWYDARSSELAGWTAVGTLGTLSHGAFLLFTAPLWVVGGAIATDAQARVSLLDISGASDWSSIAKYARFPAGLPAGLPRTLPTKR